MLSLRPADSPRLAGEDKAHIARLAETETPLPPILVDRRTMRVIDGMHRLMAASLQGRESIDVIFFDGSEADVFLRAVQENITHGLPLSQADRRAAAERIIASHPRMSDRAIGHSAGLAAKTVAAIRKSSSEEIPQSNARIGRDGRVRPLDSGAGRRRAAELLAQQPDASLRDVARAAGISPATVLDVRKRLERGQSPVPQKPAARQPAPGPATATATAARPPPASAAPAATAPPSRPCGSAPAPPRPPTRPPPSTSCSATRPCATTSAARKCSGCSTSTRPAPSSCPPPPRPSPRTASASSSSSPASTPPCGTTSPAN